VPLSELNLLVGGLGGIALRRGDRLQDLQDGVTVATLAEQGQGKFAGHARIVGCGCGWASLRAHPLPWVRRRSERHPPSGRRSGSHRRSDRQPGQRSGARLPSG